MNSKSLELIKNELAVALTGRRFGKIFQLGRSELAFDFRLAESRYLYVNLGGDPAIYLIARRLKDLEKASGNPSPFVFTLKKRLSGAEMFSVSRLPDERILRFDLKSEDEFGSPQNFLLIIQLTGRSANLFFTDDKKIILDRARETAGDGQQIGETYSPPARAIPATTDEPSNAADHAVTAAADHPSEALDNYYLEQASEKKFQTLARSATAKISAEIGKSEKLIENLKSDLARHGNAEEWKRFGDLLLSNASTGRRETDTIYVTDYFDDALPELAIDADVNDSITETAEKYYRRYTKARNGTAEISARIQKISSEIMRLQKRKTEIEQVIAERDTTILENLPERKPVSPKRKSGGKSAESTSGIRRFISSDGFEILVGKKAKDNDQLTFKVAKSLDTWMHAADYPGSHVVIRNPNRAEIPQQTLYEAARLAAFYSQGKSQVKAAVHHTQKKFVNKPKGSVPGLVSLASFKTLLVEPAFPEDVKPV